jgi:hypothetical protein
MLTLKEVISKTIFMETVSNKKKNYDGRFIMVSVRTNNKEIMRVLTNIAALYLIICTTANTDLRIFLNYKPD